MKQRHRLDRFFNGLILAVFSVAVCLPACRQAYAQTPAEQGEPAPAQSQQDLYLQAMRSISEGRHQEAEDTLLRMIEQEPQHAGAWLDLAIIDCELGHEKEAQRLFDFIEAHFSPPPGVMEVIRSRRNSGCRSYNIRDKLSVLIGRGIDDNVNQGASNPFFSLGTGSSQQTLELLPQYLPQHDQYTLLSTAYSHDFDDNGTIGFAQLQARRNDSLSQFNTASLLFGLDRPWRIGDWSVHTIGNMGGLMLDDQLYQREAQVQLRATPPLHLPDHFQFSLQAGLSYTDYATLENFNSTTDEVDAQVSYRDAKTNGSLTAGLLFDHGDAARLGGSRKGWQANLLVQRHLGEYVDGELGISIQDWNSQSLYSPGLIDQVRHQDTQVYRAGIIVPLRDYASLLHIEWRQIRDNENISLFEYKGRLLQVSLQWQNF